VTVPLMEVDLDQCAEHEESQNIFGGTNLCHESTTKCVPIPHRGFQRNNYFCQCLPNHFRPNSDYHYFNASEMEEQKLHNDTTSNSLRLIQSRCEPCPAECGNCSVDPLCSIQFDSMIRIVPCMVQLTMIIFCCITGFLVYKLKNSKVMTTSLWVMLEMILVGSVFMYSTVFIRFLEPSVLLCMLEPWFRELGYAIFYGAIVLKLYRSLLDHRTRRAYRCVIRDRDLLKYLTGLIVFVLGYMAAWTALTAHLVNEGLTSFYLTQSIVQVQLLGGAPQAFRICKGLWWDYVTETCEILFAVFGLLIAWHLRKAAKQTGSAMEHQERRALTISLILELFFSTLLYVGRHILSLETQHPDHVFLVYFARTH
ncbi:unnamed protein product, partial [Meganyctiphanes norvegica]